VRRIYLVFQDRNWTARPWTILEEDLHASVDSFEIELRARGSFDAEPFTWTGRLTGSADGTIRYEVDGSADAPFIRNRLGLCVLHPPSLTGRPVILETVGGTVVQTAFPLAISPDQPFTDMRALTHEVVPGLRATVRMTGETFESEDHRNWSDASFKHYCTPISLPFPVTVEPGDRIAQAVEVTLDGAAPTTENWSPPALRIDITADELSMPRIGIQLDHDGHRLTSEEVERLAALRLGHVRIDIDAASPAAAARLESALQDAQTIGALLVPAVHVTDVADLAPLSPWADDARIDHWLVFDPAAKVTDPALVTAAGAVLGPRVGGGTDLYFTELNRGRPPATPYVAFSLNPQVHASDEQSVMQNAGTQAVVATNARALYPDAWLEASPITLRPRFNPNATAPELDHSNTPLPSRVDARQCTDFAAAWTVLSLKAIAESGALDAVTYYEATGWEGLMERAEGSSQPNDFPSAPGRTFPVYDVLAAVAGATDVRVCHSTDPSRIDALALGNGTILVANPTAAEQAVEIDHRTITVAPFSVARLAVPWKESA
jgi:hypothetical protein